MKLFPQGHITLYPTHDLDRLITNSAPAHQDIPTVFHPINTGA